MVCCQLSPSEKDENIVNSTIANLFKDKGKFFVTWFVNGRLLLNENDFILLLTSTFAGTTSTCPRHASQSYHSPHVSEFETSGSSQGFYNPLASAPGSQYDPQLHGIKGNQPRHTPTVFFRFVSPPSEKPVMLITHLRNGQISYRDGDVRHQVPGFDVPDYVANDLSHKWSKQSDAEVVIFSDEGGNVECKVFKKIGKAMEQLIILYPDETVVLQTRIRNGGITDDGKDVLYRHSNWKSLPQHGIVTLRQNYHSVSSAELIIISDSQGNLRYVVKEGTFRKLGKF